jgi:hypothetical protein
MFAASLCRGPLSSDRRALFSMYATAIASPAALNNLFTSAAGFGALNK